MKKFDAVQYQKAAKQGDARAMFHLACCYANGIGVPKDEKAAVIWYQKAVERGSTPAMYALKYCHQNKTEI